MHETYRAKNEKLAYERLTGKLVEVGRVFDAAQKAFRNVRIRMRSLPKSLAPVLAVNNSAADIERVLLDAIDDALEGLATDIFKAPCDPNGAGRL